MVPSLSGTGGQQRRLLLVGLGNPGRRYERTRHNLGFEVLEALAGQLGAAFRSGERHQLATATYHGLELLLLKPATFMNLSGEAAAPLARRKGIRPDGILAIHDDLDLALGKVRFRRGGSAGGHRGVASLIERLGTADFARLKLGLGRPPEGVDPVEYVLLRPAPPERELLDTAVARAAEGCLMWAGLGIEAAMNAHNAPPATAEQPDPPDEPVQPRDREPGGTDPGAWSAR